MLYILYYKHYRVTIAHDFSSTRRLCVTSYFLAPLQAVHVHDAPAAFAHSLLGAIYTEESTLRLRARRARVKLADTTHRHIAARRTVTLSRYYSLHCRCCACIRANTLRDSLYLLSLYVLSIYTAHRY